MNPLRFRSLRGEGNFKSRLPSCALVGVAMLFAVGDARAAKAPTNLLPDPSACKLLNNDPRSIYERNGTTLKREYDPDVQCALNAGNESDSHNAQAITPDVASYRSAFVSTSMDLKNLGACKATYGGIREVFDAVADLQTSFCDNFETSFSALKSCDGKCSAEYTAYKNVFTKHAQNLQNKQRQLNFYLESLSKAAVRAEEKYKQDKQDLEATNQARSNAPLGDSIADAPNVKASSGNQISQTAPAGTSLDRYLEELRGLKPITALNTAIQHPSLIAEEDSAAAAARRVKKNLTDAMTEYRQFALDGERNVTTQLEQAERNGSLGDTNKLKTMADGASGLSGLTKLMPKDDETTSGASSALAAAKGGSSLAEVAAVASLGAVAAKSLGGAAGSAGGASEPAPSQGEAGGTSPKAAEIANFAEAGEPRGGKAILPVTDGTKAEPGKTDGETPSFGGGFAPSAGASRVPSGKHKVAEGSGGGNAAEPATAGATEALGGFSTNLDPHPAPKRAEMNPGAEVANLLGQMKNLFNIDENGGIGGGFPGASMPTGAPPTGAGATDGAVPMAEATTDGAPGETTAAAADSNGGPEPASVSSSGPDEMRGSPFGRVDMTLFARVRHRHQRCMEKGLVLYGLKERVE